MAVLTGPECTCDPAKLGAICHDIRDEPHLAGCPRRGTRKPDWDLVKLGICPRTEKSIAPYGNVRPACQICDCGESQ